MLQFTKATIHDTVGEVITSSNQCRQQRFKGINYQFLCKIYDKQANLVAQYSNSQKGAFKAITKEMYKIGEGTAECICHPHPKSR